MYLVYSLLSSLLFSLSIHSAVPRVVRRVVARVNGEPVFSHELLRPAPLDSANLSSLETKNELDRLIFFHLALQEARRLGVDRDPAVRNEMNRVLYRGYLEKKLTASKGTLSPSDSEIVALYEKSPLVRLRHLFLVAKNQTQHMAALKTIKKIRSALKENKGFKELVLLYSQDPSAPLGGDLGFRGFQALPEPIYTVAIQLKMGEVSSPIEFQGAIHLVQLLDRKRYQNVGAPYLARLKGVLQKEKEAKLLASLLGGLRKNAKIEIMPETMSP